MDIPIFSPVVTFAEAAPGWPGLLLSLCFFGVFAVFIVKQAFGSGPFKQLLAAFNRLPRSLQMAVLAHAARRRRSDSPRVRLAARESS